jgi:two-component system LytT family sensor kinase
MQGMQYSNREPVIFLWVMVPYSVIMNSLVWGSCIFSSLKDFLVSLVVVLIYSTIAYSLFGIVASLVKKRFPEDSQMLKRLGIILPLFCVMNIIIVQAGYFIYDRIPFLDCTTQKDMIWWATGFGCMASIIITLINEAAIGWDKWKTSIKETNRLQTAYHKSRMLGLKRQINPHFLFNCFNTLSSLISEDEEKAESFLNEMTKVYRYLLKGDDEQIVTLEEELKFINSYLYLTQVRFGEALKVNIDIEKACKQSGLPPLSLQVILENIIYRNAFSKSQPLTIDIYSEKKDGLIIRNTIQPKAPSKEIVDYEEALDNLINKYRLLNMNEVKIEETATCRTVRLPLKENEEVVA